MRSRTVNTFSGRVCTTPKLHKTDETLPPADPDTARSTSVHAWQVNLHRVLETNRDQDISAQKATAEFSIFIRSSSRRLSLVPSVGMAVYGRWQPLYSTYFWARGLHFVASQNVLSNYHKGATVPAGDLWSHFGGTKGYAPIYTMTFHWAAIISTGCLGHEYTKWYSRLMSSSSM